MDGRRLSASQIGTYLGCARKYAFRYVEGAEPEFRSPALSFGSAMHSALDWFHIERREGRTPDVAKAVQIFRADWTAELERPIAWDEDETPELYLKMGETLIRLYAGEFGGVTVCGSEIAFEVPLVDPTSGEVLSGTLSGYFDLLLPDDQLCEVKTAKRKFDAETLRRHIQLSAYHYAYRAMYDREPTLTVITLLKYKRPAIELVSAHRTEGDDAFFVHLASEVSRGIDAGIFPPNPGRLCGSCEYGRRCASWQGTPRPEAIADDEPPAVPTYGELQLTL